MPGPIRLREQLIEVLRPVLEADARIAYALVFGSAARGTAHSHSDVDIALGLTAGSVLGTLEIGELVSSLERVAGTGADIVMLHEAAPGLAYRIFRDGHLVFARDPRALAARRAQAILEYLDFRPIEDLFSRTILSTPSRRLSDGR